MNVEKAYDALRDWTAARVFNHLHHTFNAGTLMVDFCGSEVAIIELAQRVTLSAPARYIRVKFRGGPMGSRQVYTGNLLAVLVDELFHQYILGHWNRVESFLEAASA
jgi:hypothetical protein